MVEPKVSENSNASDSLVGESKNLKTVTMLTICIIAIGFYILFNLAANTIYFEFNDELIKQLDSASKALSYDAATVCLPSKMMHARIYNMTSTFEVNQNYLRDLYTKINIATVICGLVILYFIYYIIGNIGHTGNLVDDLKGHRLARDDYVKMSKPLIIEMAPKSECNV